MKYEDMSDFDINKVVAGKIFDRSEWVCVSSWSNGDFVAKLVNHTQEKFDPCNNPSDAWAIIIENKIAIDFIDGYGWTANPAFNCSISVSCHDEPLRAAMICFLKIKDAE
jgi:hypothetical protein